MPRTKDPIWANFKCSKTKNTGLWATCRKCKKEMQGILNRLRKHSSICKASAKSTISHEQLSSASSSSAVNKQLQPQPCQTTSSTQSNENRDQSKLEITKNTEAITTSKEYEENIDLQIGRYLYATNTAFNNVEHKEFIKLCSLLRPGYKPPSANQIGDSILDKVNAEATQEINNKIKGETVSVSLRGWSNIHNCPLVCVSITTLNGHSILVDTAGTESNPHNVDNLCKVATNAIRATREKFDIKIGSLVTDDAANVQRIRKELSDKEDIINYCCSEHILNLLAKDLEMPSITSPIIEVIKYFRNNRVASTLYKTAGGKELDLPLDLRWSTMIKSLKSYDYNRTTFIRVCEDYNDKIDKTVVTIVNNYNITKNCADLLTVLLTIENALNQMQRKGTTISAAVEIWNKLEIDLAQSTLNVMLPFRNIKRMALSGVHYAANMLDHRFRGRNLSNEQKIQAYEYIREVDVNFITFVMALVGQADPFPRFMFESHFENMHPTLWWKSVILKDEKLWPDKGKFLTFCDKLLTATAVTAGFERQFSTIKLHQSKLQNGWDNEKASKFGFLFNFLNNNAE